MTKFEQIGMEYQCEAESIRDAQKCFRRSCQICCERGIRVECDRCAISFAHDMVVAAFNVVETAKSVSVKE